MRDIPLGSGRISTDGPSPLPMPGPRSPPRLLVKRTGGAGGLSSSLDILKNYAIALLLYCSLIS